MKKALVSIPTVAAVVLAIALAFSHLKQTGLEEQNRSLRHQLEALTSARAETTASADLAAPPQSQSEQSDAEIVRLRGEVTTLRREKAELENLRAENQKLRTAQAQAQAAAPRDLAEIKTPRSYPRENWSFTGYADPESALQSVLWAGTSRDPATILAGFTPEQIAQMRTEDNQNRSETEVAERIAQQVSKIKSFQILQNDLISDHEAVLTLYLDGMEGSEQTPKMKMQRVGNEWRLAGPYRPEQAKQ